MLPLFFMLVFGILEFGFAFRNYLTVANGTRDGARTGATAGNVASADRQVLQAIRSSTSAMPASQIEQIVIFRATGPQDEVPEACAVAGSLGQKGERACNVYTPADFALAASQFDCDGPGIAPDDNWCPADRKVAVGGIHGPPDYLGVWIRVRYDYITGLFPGDGLVFEDTTVMRLEPRTIE